MRGVRRLTRPRAGAQGGGEALGRGAGLGAVVARRGAGDLWADDARAARAAGVTALGFMLPGAKDEAAKILAAAGADAVLSAGIHELASFLPKDVQERLTEGTTATTTTSASAAGEDIALRRTSAEQFLSKEVTLWRATESPKPARLSTASSPM